MVFKQQKIIGLSMNNGKAPTKKYQDYLIASLRDPEAAAAYLTAILEESNPEPGLLAAALQDISTAIGSPAAQAQAATLPVAAPIAIASLTEYLTSLGLQLVVVPIPDNRSHHHEPVVLAADRVPSSV
jgi:DNA-binding phage protein